MKTYAFLTMNQLVRVRIIEAHRTSVFAQPLYSSTSEKPSLRKPVTCNQ